MNVQISETSKTPNGSYFQATCGKVSGMVCVHPWGLQVICQNTAHKVWRGAGRFFPTAAEALENYRSGEMKAIIGAAVEFAGGAK